MCHIACGGRVSGKGRRIKLVAFVPANRPGRARRGRRGRAHFAAKGKAWRLPALRFALIDPQRILPLPNEPGDIDMCLAFEVPERQREAFDQPGAQAVDAELAPQGR